MNMAVTIIFAEISCRGELRFLFFAVGYSQLWTLKRALWADSSLQVLKTRGDMSMVLWTGQTYINSPPFSDSAWYRSAREQSRLSCLYLELWIAANQLFARSSHRQLVTWLWPILEPPNNCISSRKTWIPRVYGDRMSSFQKETGTICRVVWRYLPHENTGVISTQSWEWNNYLRGQVTREPHGLRQ